MITSDMVVWMQCTDSTTTNHCFCSSVSSSGHIKWTNGRANERVRRSQEYTHIKCALVHCVRAEVDKCHEKRVEIISKTTDENY